MVKTGGEAPSWVGLVTACWEGRGCRRGPCWALGEAILQPLGLGQGRAEGPVEQDRPGPLRQKQGAGTKERPKPSLPSWPEPRQPSSAPACKGRASSTPTGGVSAPSMPEELFGVHPHGLLAQQGGCLSQVTWQSAAEPEFDLGQAVQTLSPRCWQQTRCAEMTGQVGRSWGVLAINSPVTGPLATPGWTCV